MRTLRFQPVYQERVWGGRWLEDKFGRKLPGDGPIGEAWEIVDRPEAQSVCARSGRTLRELLQQHPTEIMGPRYEPSRPFPILVKWLDCSDRLSLQVHPAVDVAQRLGDEPKTECWYLADTRPGAALIVGLKNGVTREVFEQAVEDDALEPLLHRFTVQRGQSILLESGRLHAIDAGNLILEIQQNSDTTYRVYDWGRQGLDGKPRQLHLAESLQSIDFEDFEPSAQPVDSEQKEMVLAECQQFRIRQVRLSAGESVTPPKEREPMILSVVEGELEEEPLQAGHGGEVYPVSTNVLLPYAWDGELVCRKQCKVLITDQFI